jgi:hypothetical protein
MQITAGKSVNTGEGSTGGQPSSLLDLVVIDNSEASQEPRQ